MSAEAIVGIIGLAGILGYWFGRRKTEQSLVSLDRWNVGNKDPEKLFKELKDKLNDRD